MKAGHEPAFFLARSLYSAAAGRYNAPSRVTGRVDGQ